MALNNSNTTLLTQCLLSINYFYKFHEKYECLYSTLAILYSVRWQSVSYPIEKRKTRVVQNKSESIHLANGQSPAVFWKLKILRKPISSISLSSGLWKAEEANSSLSLLFSVSFQEDYSPIQFLPGKKCIPIWEKIGKSKEISHLGNMDLYVGYIWLIYCI